ncbi:MAG: hypothetical protein IPM57_09890 [Oligoflexia bacterium]|nr:hypothetical protein [Oligoflexia bacterium]
MTKNEKLKGIIQKTFSNLKKHINRVWYTPLIGLLSALDNFFVIIPNDGILISSSILSPKKWFWFALSVAIGSALGAWALAAAVELKGLPWILEHYPGLDQTKTWVITHDFFKQYGLAVVFVIAITPLLQQPAVILASLAEAPLLELTIVIFVGRFIKYLIMAYVGSHTPKLLNKMWGVKSELEEVGTEIK